MAISALNIESARQAWAGWLVGVLLVYGLLPRLGLALLCLWRWRRGRATLRLDLNLPGYAQLRERLMPSGERLGVNDTAPAQLHPHRKCCQCNKLATAHCWWQSSWTAGPGRPSCPKP